MASGDFGVSPEGRNLEPRREGVTDAIRRRFAFGQELALQKFVDTTAKPSAAPIYLIERRAIELRRHRWREPSPPQTGHGQSTEQERSETSFTEYVRPPPAQKQASGSTSEDRPSWFRRLFRGRRRP